MYLAEKENGHLWMTASVMIVSCHLFQPIQHHNLESKRTKKLAGLYARPVYSKAFMFSAGKSCGLHWSNLEVGILILPE